MVCAPTRRRKRPPKSDPRCAVDVPTPQSGRFVPRCTRTARCASEGNVVDFSCIPEGERFSLILVDPPWSYGAGGASGLARDRYALMTQANMCAMDVGRFARDNCALLMWTTCAMMPEAMQLGAAWGFEFLTVLFNWVKTNPKSGNVQCGLGHYTRQCVEYVVLFRRGRISHFVQDRAVSSLLRTVEDDPAAPEGAQSIVAPEARGRHSEKPDAIYGEFRRLFGDLPILEIFARKVRGGVSCFGNQLVVGERECAAAHAVTSASGTSQYVPSARLDAQRAHADYKDHVVSAQRSDARRAKVEENRARRAAASIEAGVT